MKTLIAIDGSTEATAAVRTAVRLLRKQGNEILVVCVVPEFSDSPLSTESRAKHEKIRSAYAQRMSKDAESILDSAQQILSDEGLRAGVITEFGSPAKTIVRLSAESDVTVVGATGKRDRSKLGIGPVASRVVEHGRGMILVARELGGDSSWRVLLAVDGSASSAQALRAINTYFNAAALEVTCLHVVETPWLQFGLEERPLDYPADVSEKLDPEIQLAQEMKREANLLVEDAAVQLEGKVLGVNTIIREGNPAIEILGEADAGEYDLIMIGAASSSDFKHQMLGSVSAKVAAQAPCSVAVVKFEE